MKPSLLQSNDTGRKMAPGLWELAKISDFCLRDSTAGICFFQKSNVERCAPHSSQPEGAVTAGD